MFENLEAPRKDGAYDIDAHHYCDYVELLALVQNGDPVSWADVSKRFGDVAEVSGSYDDFDSEPSMSGSGDSDLSYNTWESRIQSWFQILEQRKFSYGYGYPFKVTNSKIEFKNSMNDLCWLYVFLLLCSVQSYIQRKHRSTLTSYFEEVSLIAFRNYLPVISKVRPFGKSQTNDGPYTGRLPDRYRLLAKDLGYPTDISDKDFSSRDSGDGGLDLVGWIPFRDDSTKDSIQVFLGQCATGKGWINKQSEVQKISNAIPRLRNYSSVMFTPYDVRDYNRDLSRRLDISVDIFIDRFRLYRLLTNSKVNWIKTMPRVSELIREAIQYQEDYV